jgi:hypothetical protein
MKTILTLAALLSFAGFASAQPRPPADMLAARVAELERRVGALEQRAGIPSPTVTQAAPAAPQATFSPAPQWVDPGLTYAPQTYAPAFAAPLYTSFGGFGDGGACANGQCGGGVGFAPFGGRFSDGPVRRFLRR